MAGDIPFEVYMNELKKVPNWKSNRKPLTDTEKKFILEAKKAGATMASVCKVLKRNRVTIDRFIAANY